MDLFNSVKENDLENVRVLLTNDNININYQDEVGNTALICAVHLGYQDIVELLLNFGINIDVNIQNSDGNTALIWAAAKNNIEIIKLLLNHHDIKVNIQDEVGDTALIWAANYGHKDIVKALLEFDGIDVNIKNLNGLSALNEAALHGHKEVILDLIKHPNIDLNINVKFKNNMLLHRDFCGNVFLHEALSNKCDVKFIQDIIKACPSCASIENNNHKTPLDVAFENELSVEIIAILLINSSNSNYLLPLFGTNRYASHPIYGPLLKLLEETSYKSIVRLHLCGFEGVGKTTLRNCIESSLRNNYFSSSVADVTQSTVGMDISKFNDKEIKYVVFDYGGQSEYHVNHSRFLSCKNSIYVIVLSLCKFRDEKGQKLKQPILITEDDLADLSKKYNYWLKFINITTSNSNNDNVANVITCLNHDNSFNLISVIKKRPLEIFKNAQQKIMNVQKEWLARVSHINRIKFVNSGKDLALIDVKSTHSVKEKLLRILRNEDCKMISETLCSNFKVVDKIVSMRDRGEWFDIGPRSVFKSKIVETFLNNIPENLKNGLAEAILTQLETIGEVFTFDYDNIKSYIVTNPNKLCSNILGKLAKYLNKKKKTLVYKDLKSYSISKEEIMLISSNIKCYSNIDNDIVIQLLELLGVCIKCSDGNFFPVFAADSGIVEITNIFDLKEEFKPYSRRVHRRFKLSDTSLQMFPRGYFPTLFVYISLMATIEGNFQLYTNAILLPERGRVGKAELPHMETIIMISDDESYFDVIVQSWIDQPPSSHIEECRYLNRLNDIKFLLYHDPKFVHFNMDIDEYAIHADPMQSEIFLFTEVEENYKVYSKNNSPTRNDVLPWLFGINGNRCGIDPQVSSNNSKSMPDSIDEIADNVNEISNSNKSLHLKVDDVIHILSNPNLSPNRPVLPPINHRQGPAGSSVNR